MDICGWFILDLRVGFGGGYWWPVIWYLRDVLVGGYLWAVNSGFACGFG